MTRTLWPYFIGTSWYLKLNHVSECHNVCKETKIVGLLNLFIGNLATIHIANSVFHWIVVLSSHDAIIFVVHTSISNGEGYLSWQWLIRVYMLFYQNLVIYITFSIYAQLWLSSKNCGWWSSSFASTKWMQVLNIEYWIQWSIWSVQWLPVDHALLWENSNKFIIPRIQ